MEIRSQRSEEKALESNLLFNQLALAFKYIVFIQTSTNCRQPAIPRISQYLQHRGHFRQPTYTVLGVLEEETVILSN